MKKILKLALIPLACLLVSCGQKAPDVGSSEVEELVAKIITERSYGSVDNAPEGLEIKLINVIKVGVDNDAQRTKFTFCCRVKERTSASWREESYRFKAIASYSESGDLFVEVFENNNAPANF